MVEKAFPTIRNAYKHLKKHIVIQIDGARPHVKSSIQALIKAECFKQGYNITLEWQPTQSLGFNVLDLGCFSLFASPSIEDQGEQKSTGCCQCPDNGLLRSRFQHA